MTALPFSRTVVGDRCGPLPARRLLVLGLAAAFACAQPAGTTTPRAEAARARAASARARGDEEAAAFWEGLAAEQARLRAPAGQVLDDELVERLERGRAALGSAEVVMGYQSFDQEVVRAALADLEHVVGRAPWVADHQYWAGYGWFLAQDFERARGRFETAAELDPGHHDAWQALGTIHLNAGAAELALEPLTRVVELVPDDPNAHYVLGKCREELGELAGAEACYRRALELHPGLIEPYNRLGGVLLRVGRRAEGERMLDEFLWWKEHEKALRGRAPSGPRGAPELEALRGRLAALATEAPDDGRLAVAHARVLLALGRDGEARKELRHARRAARGEVDLLFDVAQQWRLLGDLERSQALLWFALRGDANHVESRLALAALLARGGRPEAAREQYRAVLELAPDCARARDVLADEGATPR